MNGHLNVHISDGHMNVHRYKFLSTDGQTNPIQEPPRI